MPFLCDVMKSWLRACVHIAFFLRHKSAGRALWRDSDDTSTFLKTSATSVQSDGTKKVRVLWKKTGRSAFFLGECVRSLLIGNTRKKTLALRKKAVYGHSALLSLCVMQARLYPACLFLLNGFQTFRTRDQTSRRRDQTSRTSDQLKVRAWTVAANKILITILIYWAQFFRLPV